MSRRMRFPDFNPACDCICHDRGDDRLRGGCVLGHDPCGPDVHPFHPRSSHRQQECVCALLPRRSVPTP